MIVHYVDPSMDAAIAEGLKDLKFINNTDAPIYIEASADGSTLHFAIYGHETRDPNRTVRYESETTNTEDPTPSLTEDANRLEQLNRHRTAIRVRRRGCGRL